LSTRPLESVALAVFSEADICSPSRQLPEQLGGLHQALPVSARDRPPQIGCMLANFDWLGVVIAASFLHGWAPAAIRPHVSLASEDSRTQCWRFQKARNTKAPGSRINKSLMRECSTSKNRPTPNRSRLVWSCANNRDILGRPRSPASGSGTSHSFRGNNELTKFVTRKVNLLCKAEVQSS
jgi:hypothetical protein